MGIYFLIPRKGRNGWLVLSSLVFYACGEPRFVFLFMAEILWNWIIGIVVDAGKTAAAKKAALVIGIAGDIAVLGVFKYANFLAETITSMTRGEPLGFDIILPIGISFYTFQAISYIVDIYRGETAQKNPLHVALYLALFPQLIAGPIVRYDHIRPQLENRKASFDEVSEGFMRFCRGLCKKVLLANNLAIVSDLVFDTWDQQVLPAPVLWMGVISYTLQIYFDFSGYSDMAIGLARVFGFHIPENFKDPYLSVSGADFWRRWHISLSSWFRDYVYIPLGGSRHGNAQTIRNLLIVWGLTGLWHGAGWTFILWGLLWGVLLIAEKFLIRPDTRGKLFRVIYRILLLLWIVLMWTLFRAESIASAASIIAALFSPERWLMSAANADMVLMWFSQAIPWLAAGAVFSSSIPKAIKARLENGTAGTIMRPVGAGILLLLVVLSLSFLINGSYNPFLYFQF
ncbi:MAG: MBOAT family O-acyltransferase [Bacillota bacterium]|nr:MBOAT family O-acyltransferase [Bacillota bacterium]